MFGSGVGIDMEEAEDDMLAMQLSNLYHTCMRQGGATEQWFQDNLHKVCWDRNIHLIQDSDLASHISRSLSIYFSLIGYDIVVRTVRI